MNWKELSDTSKALIYLAGVVASAFVGGAIAVGTLRPILDAPDQISEIREILEAKIAELEADIESIATQNELTKSLSDKNSTKVATLEEILEVTNQPFSGASQSAILNRHADQIGSIPNYSLFVRSNSLPDFDTFALRTQIPNLSGYARISQLPDMSQYAKHSDIPGQPDLSSYLRSGDRITAQGVSGKYLFDLDSRNRDEIDVVMSSAQEWRIRKSN